MRTRRQRQIEDEAPFALPHEQLAKAFSHLDLRSLLCTAACVCKRWRAVIASNAVAWTTAMSELDSLAIIGPQGVKALAQRLTRSGGWLELAARLGNKACYAPACTALGLYFDSSKHRRACHQHARAGSRVHINDFIFESAPWRTVSSGVELQNALRDCPEGACIRVTGHIQFPAGSEPEIKRCRLSGPLCAPGQAPQASITHMSCPFIPVNAVLQDLKLITGNELILEEILIAGSGWFPALQPEANTLLRNCRTVSYTVRLCTISIALANCHMPSPMTHLLCVHGCVCLQGSSLMLQGSSTVRVAADDCTFESHEYLGIVVQEQADEDAAKSSLSLRGCTMTNNHWGASLGCDLSDEDERVIRAVNTFDDNVDKDITRHYEDKK
jgi:F-box-like